MSSKKKPAKAKAPAPLLKLKFEKFPEKPVPVFFDAAKRVFTAQFGFGEYEAASVAGLETKIQAAIKAGAKPTVEWIPVILISEEGEPDDKRPDRFTSEAAFSAQRVYLAITKNGLSEVDWNVPASQRAMRSTTCSVGYQWDEAKRMKLMPKLPYAGKQSWQCEAILPYDESTWQNLCAVIGQMQAARASLQSGIKKLDFSSVFVPKAAAAKKPAALKPAAPAMKLTPRAKERIKENLEKRVEERNEKQRREEREMFTSPLEQRASTAPPARDSAPPPAAVPPKPKAKPKAKAKPKPAPKPAVFAQGTQPPEMVARLGYPPGTRIVVSGNKADVLPPGHVAMLYSVDWLEKRLAAGGHAPLYNQPPLITEPEEDAEEELVEA